MSVIPGNLDTFFLQLKICDTSLFCITFTYGMDSSHPMREKTTTSNSHPKCSRRAADMSCTAPQASSKITSWQFMDETSVSCPCCFSRVTSRAEVNEKVSFAEGSNMLDGSRRGSFGTSGSRAAVTDPRPPSHNHRSSTSDG